MGRILVGWMAATLVLLAGCARRQTTALDIDAGLASAIAGIRAIDNHAHPVRMAAAGEAADREFDALPVDNMEPSTDPLALRDGASGAASAWHALFGADKLQSKQRARMRTMAEKRDAY